MDTDDRSARHPIRVVAQRTGLTPAAIRAWERRYDAVRPGRSEGGQRLYTDRDVTRLTMLKELTSVGRSISMVAGLSDEEARALLDEDRLTVPMTHGAADKTDPRTVVSRAYMQILGLDGDGLERLLWRAAMSLDGQTFLDDVVAPLLKKVGEGWIAGEMNPGQEHMGSDVIDRVLARVAEPSNAPDGAVLVVATMTGERHGLGARLVAAAAAVDGWNVTYLGTDLPAPDIVSAAEGLGARAVAISVVSRERIDETVEDLNTLRSTLSPAVDVLVGGSGALLLPEAQLPAGVAVVHGLEGFRKLRRNRP